MSPTPSEFSRVNFTDSPKQEYGQVNPSDTYPERNRASLPLKTYRPLYPCFADLQLA
jgi:hypothetical protein